MRRTLLLTASAVVMLVACDGETSTPTSRGSVDMHDAQVAPDAAPITSERVTIADVRRLGAELDRVVERYERTSAPWFDELAESWSSMNEAVVTDRCMTVLVEAGRHRDAATSLRRVAQEALDDTADVMNGLSALELPISREGNSLRITVQRRADALRQELLELFAADQFSTDEIVSSCLS